MIWLKVALIALLVSMSTGCAAMGIPELGGGSVSRKTSLARMDPAHIQVDTMGFADRFVTTMTSVYDEIERDATKVAAKDAAHQLKTDLALGAISSAVNPRPIAGMIDMFVLVTLLRQIAEDPWTAETFGPDAARLIATLRRQEADIRSLARRYLTDDQMAELLQLAEKWHKAHPDERAVSHVHLAEMPEANLPPEVAAKLPNSVFGLLFFDPTANLDPAVREIKLSRATSERMFFYLQRLPLLLQLQVENFYRLMLESPQVKQALVDVSASSASTTRFAEVAGQFTEVVGKFPQQLTNQRQEAIVEIAAELGRQREATIKQVSDAVTLQREAAIQQIMDAVTVQREAAIKQATTNVAAERDEAVRQIATAVGNEQKLFVSNLEASLDRSITRLMKGMTLLALGVFAGLMILAVVYRMLMRPVRAPRTPRLVATTTAVP
jgi:hypothetical protein